jgi:hypothetical protein
MAQTGRAMIGPSLQIAITFANGKWDTNPPRPPQAAVDNGGQVTFHCAPANGCRVYTNPPDAFVGEVAGFLQLVHGNNNFTVTGGADDTDMNYCVCDPNSSCNPTKLPDTGPYTIQVGNPPEEGNKN